jgi:hypothetical protein
VDENTKNDVVLVGAGIMSAALGAPPLLQKSGINEARGFGGFPRAVNGKDWLLIGRFASWSPKFLKAGEVTDLPLSAKPTVVPATLGVMQRCFYDRYQGRLPRLKEMVPSLGVELSDEPALFNEVWSRGTKMLGLGSGTDAGRAPEAVGPDDTATATDSGHPEPAGVV